MDGENCQPYQEWLMNEAEWEGFVVPPCSLEYKCAPSPYHCGNCTVKHD